MSEQATTKVNGAVPASASLADLLHAVSGRSREEKRAILDRILRDLIGDEPSREYALPNPDGSPYLFLVPPSLFRPSWETAEFLAELDRRRTSPGSVKPNSEVLAKLDALLANEQSS